MPNDPRHRNMSLAERIKAGGGGATLAEILRNRMKKIEEEEKVKKRAKKHNKAKKMVKKKKGFDEVDEDVHDDENDTNANRRLDRGSLCNR